MSIVKGAIGRMLVQHEPHPALVLDRYWNVIQTNEAASILWLIRRFGQKTKAADSLDLLFDPAGMRPFVEEWEQYSFPSRFGRMPVAALWIAALLQHLIP
jgi:hypothetical protein